MQGLIVLSVQSDFVLNAAYLPVITFIKHYSSFEDSFQFHV